MEEIKLIDRVALVTGASSGIGRGVAVQFAKLGAQLALTGRDRSALEETLRLCSDVAPDLRVLLIAADLTKTADLQRVVSQTLEKFTRLDILVNSAGILKADTAETLNMETYESVMNINLHSLIQLTHLATPHLIKTKGTVVNVSSVNGMRSFSGVMSYCVSKAGVDQFTRCTALDLASKGVRVNSVNPGVTITEVHRRSGMDEERYQAFLEHSKSTHALGRAAQPAEIARAVAFLASDASSFITGVSLPVDGGRHAMCPR